MNKAQEITQELEQEVQSASKNPFAGKLIAPLRLFLVWMKLTNQRLAEIEAQFEEAIHGE